MSALLKQTTGKSVLEVWNTQRRDNIDANMIPSLLPKVQDRHVNIYDIFRFVTPSIFKTQPGLLFWTYYPGRAGSARLP